MASLNVAKGKLEQMSVPDLHNLLIHIHFSVSTSSVLIISGTPVDNCTSIWPQVDMALKMLSYSSDKHENCLAFE